MPQSNAPQAFIDWLIEWQKRENWNGITAMAREIGISHPSLIDIITHRKKPSFTTCLAIAKRARVSPEFILRLAGLLPEHERFDQEISELVGVFELLGVDDQKRMIEIGKTLLLFNDNRKDTK